MRINRSTERDNIFYEVQRVPSQFIALKCVTISTNWKSFQWIKNDERSDEIKNERRTNKFNQIIG